MKIEHIRNGSLYWNTETKRVERVIGKLNGSRVWTYWHGQQERGVRVNNLRKATKTEWQLYLDGKDVGILGRVKYKLEKMISSLKDRDKQMA
tara:strand:- start:1001 stop:1276 length:276 start_codon:yes stop_codon:yes gene_type:complete